MPPPGRTARQIAARGLTFDVHIGGPPDGEPVLLLHGFPQHSGEWDDVVPALHDTGLRTYALDQRGYSPGARPPAVADYRIAECVADALAVLDALRVDSAHVVGHDWGALVAWQLAARHPDRVRTLTAVSVPHPAAMAHAMATDADQRERSSYIGLFRQEGKAERVLLADDAAALRGMLSGCVRVEEYVVPMQAPGALTAALNWYRAMSRAELGGVGPVPVPTTYVWSDRDLAVGAVAAKACGANVTGEYTFVPLAGVSHWIPDEAPQALADAVLARVGRR
jgi:pimeloyl-ACP methyl ester carboxylesterase